MFYKFAKTSISFIFFFLAFAACADDYQNETLKEVLINAVYRDGPSIDANKLGIIPGGFVISVTQSKESKDWFKIHKSEGYDRESYIHSSLLAAPSTSYIQTEIKNEVHLIKNFQPRRDLSPIHPQAHARIYSQDGLFLSHFPRLKDLSEFQGAVRIWPQNLDSELPHYSLLYYTGGAHCCKYWKFVSKEPFGDSQFNIGTDMSLVSYDKNVDEYTFLVKDDTYTYWNYSYASSPLPEVVLKFVKGKFVVSEEMVKDTYPTVDEFNKLVSSQPKLHPELDGFELDKALGRLTGNALQFIYAGQPDKAREFIDAVWPKHVRLNHKNLYDRESFKEELSSKVKRSPYYQAWMSE